MKSKIQLLMALLLGVVLVFGLSIFLQASGASAQSSPDRAKVIQSALAYLKAQQQADGGILGFSGVSDPDTTARVVMAFAANGEPAKGVLSSGGKTMLDYLSTQAISFTHDITGNLFPGRAGILLSAISLEGITSLEFGGVNLAAQLEAAYQPSAGAYSTNAQTQFSSGQASDVNQAWSILGLTLAGRPIPKGASQYLVHSQAADGSWGSGDPDTTALVVAALLTSRQAGVKDEAIQKALGYFHATQLDSAGWRPSWDTDPLNADSTGWILQALLSAGEDPAGEAWTKNKTNPVDALLSLQKPDGSIGGTNANTYSTAEALLGLSGMPFSDARSIPISHQAGLVVFYGDGTLFTQCVSFPEPSISGLDLLQRSTLSIATATNPTQGTAVCKIGKVGSPSENCFGSMPNYWSYWQMGSGAWEYSSLGADQIQVVDGSVNAWSWGPGDPPAVLVTYQNICEGVPFVLPTLSPTAATAAGTAQPSLIPAEPTSKSVQPTVATTALPATQISTPPSSAARTSTGAYVIYGLILLVLVALVVLVVNSRRK